MRFEPRTPIKGGMTIKGPCSYCDKLDAPLNQTPKQLSIEEMLAGVESKGIITCLKCGHFWGYQVGGAGTIFG